MCVAVRRLDFEDGRQRVEGVHYRVARGVHSASGADASGTSLRTPVTTGKELASSGLIALAITFSVDEDCDEDNAAHLVHDPSRDAGYGG